jgi:hypothetical protein
MSVGCSHKWQKNGWGTHVLRVLSKILFFKTDGGRMSLGYSQTSQKNGGGRMSSGCSQKSQKFGIHFQIANANLGVA